jgi:RND family efflux transporter MFP subunit
MNRISFLAVLAAVSVPLLVSACERSGRAQERPLAAPDTSPARPPAASSAPEGPRPPCEIAGDLKPAQAANPSFKIGGRLASLRVARGDRVKKGQVLATLSDAEARATLAQAQAAVQAARAQAAIAEDAERRATRLGAADVVPESTVTAAKLSADAARPGVRQALAAASLAQANLGNHVLTAPFDGGIVLVPEGTGETVGPGIPMMRLEDLTVLVLRATASESDLASVAVGDELDLTTAGGTSAQGKVRTIVRSLDPVSRRAPV